MANTDPVVFVNFDPGMYLHALSEAIAGHLGDLRVALRSLDDGSFTAKAAKPRPGALLNFSFEPQATPDAVATRLCNRCFVNVVGALITYLDRMIAVQVCTANQMRIPNGITTPTEVRDIVQKQLEVQYMEVAKNTRLSNPKKIDSFPKIAPIARDSALSYFAVRRSLEHHGGRSEELLTLWFGRLKLISGAMEITVAGQPGLPGEGISLSMDYVARHIPAGAEVAIKEDELEHIVFTIQNLIGPEIRRIVIETRGANVVREES